MITNSAKILASFKTDKIGMWVFLASELCFLAAIFIAFVAYQHSSHEAFNLARLKMNLWAGSLNTLVLLTSSLCVAMGDHFYKNNKTKLAFYSLLSAMGLGILFLIIKISEYVEHAHEHLLPGIDFHYQGNEAVGFKMFFILYFIMTGIHAFHLLIGVFILAFVSFRVKHNFYNPLAPAGLEVAALYWHFVDLIWIFLFPLLYLREVT